MIKDLDNSSKIYCIKLIFMCLETFTVAGKDVVVLVFMKKIFICPETVHLQVFAILAEINVVNNPNLVTYRLI